MATLLAAAAVSAAPVPAVVGIAITGSPGSTVSSW